MRALATARPSLWFERLRRPPALMRESFPRPLDRVRLHLCRRWFVELNQDVCEVLVSRQAKAMRPPLHLSKLVVGRRRR